MNVAFENLLAMTRENLGDFDVFVQSIKDYLKVFPTPL